MSETTGPAKRTRAASKSATEPAAVDGRRARSERTKRLLADAFLSLLSEGDLRPTAHRIAERAKVSLRMVFHHFDDLESMFTLVAETQTRRVMSAAHPIPPAGPLADRIRKFVIQRSSVLEQMTPVRRAALLAEPFSPVVASRVDEMRSWKRHAALTTFGPELDAMPSDLRSTTTAAVSAALSYSGWDALRRQQRLSVYEARCAQALILAKLLGLAEPARALDGLGEDIAPEAPPAPSAPTK